MAPLTDPDRLEAYKNALGNWAVGGYVRFNVTEQSRRWVRRELGVELKELGRRMHEYVQRGGEIDEVRERRLEWSGEHEFHYDLRFSIQGTPLYVETRLNFHPPFKPDEPWISVVNVHAP